MRSRLVPVLVFLPTLLAVVYFGVIASPRYVSEAQFVVRTASKPSGAAGLGALLQMTGLSRAHDDVFAVQAFMTSRNAVAELDKLIPLREIFGRAEADTIARFPSYIYGPSLEELHRYLGWMVETIYDSKSGITTLRVQAFRPGDAKLVADQLMFLSEQTVNRLNERIQRDAVQNADAEVRRNEARLISAQQAITKFRNSELMIDPAGSSLAVVELIGRLGAELAQTESQQREVSSGATENPQLLSLRRRAEALRGQIDQERGRISSDKDGLAAKLATYERVVLDREFAKQALTTAVRALEAAQSEARRQQLYLERIVEPVAPDKAMAPERLRLVFSALGLNVLFGLVAWLVFSGLREHSSQNG
ncbi:MAG: capsule biosynthesis protein [Hyphomicrobium sp.]